MSYKILRRERSLTICLFVRQDGFTVILIERQEGVNTRPIKMGYSASAGTAYVTFDNVKVPVENTLGEEGGGIFVMLRCAHITCEFTPTLKFPS